MVLLGRLDGETQQGQWLELTTASQAVRYLRVVTTASPSWVGWNEIEAYGTPVGGEASQVEWVVADQLGTPRMVIDESGTLSGVKRHDYLPFGEEIQPGIGGRTTNQGYSVANEVRQRYTGAERDDETGLDFMQARYYASTQGRFTSPDPLLASGRIARPQSWNRYAYVLNNPLRLTDPTGFIDSDPNDQEKKKQEQQQQSQLPISVKVEVPPAKVFTNEKLPDGTYLTGVGSKITVTLTDANNKPLAGATVTETNKQIPIQVGESKPEGTQGIIQNQSTVTTSPAGTFQDYVVKGNTTATPEFGESGETIEGFKEFINGTNINSTTEQTLIIKAADGNNYQITYQRTVTNVGPDGRLNEKVNENGLNVVVKTTPPVIKRLP